MLTIHNGTWIDCGCAIYPKSSQKLVWLKNYLTCSQELLWLWELSTRKPWVYCGCVTYLKSSQELLWLCRLSTLKHGSIVTVWTIQIVARNYSTVAVGTIHNETWIYCGCMIYLISSQELLWLCKLSATKQGSSVALWTIQPGVIVAVGTVHQWSLDQLWLCELSTIKSESIAAVWSIWNLARSFCSCVDYPQWSKYMLYLCNYPTCSQELYCGCGNYP